MREHVFIIAEAGDNHNGDYELALRLVDKAVEAGADCVKFQTFLTEEIISKRAPKAEYQINNTGSEESQFDMVKKLELSFDDFRRIKKYCDDKRIMFLSTPYDKYSINFLNELDIALWKIPSAEINNVPYLRMIAKTKKPVILATGMSTMEEVRFAVDILKNNGTTDITLLQCNSEYPTPYKDVNLSAMYALKNEFNCMVGYSDHTQGIEIPMAAVAMGAKVIEKHFTLNHNMIGPDHSASLEPDELKHMITGIRNIELAMGDGKKEPSESERRNIGVMRTSIVAAKLIEIGEIFDESNLATKRPADGLSPAEWDNVVGKVAKRKFNFDEAIEI